MAKKKKSAKKKRINNKTERPRIMQPADVTLPPNVRAIRYNRGSAIWAVDGAGNCIALGYWPD
jgi:hypothetical protein